MAGLSKTGIPYADYGWPLVTGCSNAGPACDHCYAARYAATRGRHLPQYAGLAFETSVFDCKRTYGWTGEVRFHPEQLDRPLHTKKLGRVFTVPTGDLFHEGVATYDLDDVFAVMARTPHLTYIIVTKRAERMHRYMSLEYPTKSTLAGKPWPLPNVTLLPSVWDQESADRVIPLLLATPAAVRGVSIEPMLGAVDLSPWIEQIDFCRECDAESPPQERDLCPECGGVGHLVSTWGCEQAARMRSGARYEDDGPHAADTSTLDLVVLGGETGPGARPMQPEWALDVYQQCKAAGVPFWFKSMGTAPHKKVWDWTNTLGAEMQATHELPAVTL